MAEQCSTPKDIIHFFGSSGIIKQHEVKREEFERELDKNQELKQENSTQENI